MSARINAHAGKMPGSKVVTNTSITGTDGQSRSREKTKSIDNNIGFQTNREDTSFYATNSTSNEILRLAEVAFSVKDNFIHVDAQADGGHIQWIEYSYDYKLMRVCFGGPGGPRGVPSRQDVCIYKGIHYIIFEELRHALVNNVKHGSYKTGRKKHLVGVRFWDLVRIRGQIYGSRFPFEYDVKLSSRRYKLTGEGRHTFVLSDKNLKLLFPNRNFKSGEKVSVMLSDEQLDRLLQNEGFDTKDLIIDTKVSYFNGKLNGVASIGMEDAILDKINKERGINDIDIQQEKINAAKRKRLENRQPGLLTKEENEELTALGIEYQYNIAKMNELAFNDIDKEYLKSVEDNIRDKFQSQAAQLKLTPAEAERFANNAIKQQIYQRIAENAGVNAYDNRVPLSVAKHFTKALPNNYEAVTDELNYRTPYMRSNWKFENASKEKLTNILGSEKANRVIELRKLGKFKIQDVEKHGGKVWTPAKLTEFGFVINDGNHISMQHKAAYMKYIDNKDWYGAYQFLRRNKHDIKINGVSTGYERYAGPNDVLEIDE